MGKFASTLKEEKAPMTPKKSESTSKRKRGGTTTQSKGKAPVVDLTLDADESTPAKKKKKSSPKKGDPPEEKRLRQFRKKAPHTYLDRLHRAQTQRMFVIDRSRGGTEDAPEEKIDLAGTTGNVYTVNIGHVPSCTCPDHAKGNQCKHIIYVLHLILKAPEDLQYQLAFLSAELRDIFATAPAPISTASKNSGTEEDASSNRKPCEGDCPICFMPLDPEEEEIVWCRAACGNNLHSDCFEQWAKSQAGKEVKCVYCRTPWQGDEEKVMKICKEKAKNSSGEKNADGYVNVGQELGLSGARDMSTYHQFWVRRQGWGYY